jgi:6-phosphofructokinase 2
MTDTPDTAVAVLALNPSVDISYEIPQLLEYQKVRARQTWYHPGGNGINVARALAELQVPVRCCSIIAGESGELLLRLLGDTLGEAHTWLSVPGETRLNTTILQHSPPGQYEITSVGPEIPPAVLAETMRCFLQMAGDGFAVLTGLLPPGVPDGTYRELAEQIGAQGGRVVVDASGPVLDEALQAQPYLVRLNHYVLETTIKRRLVSTRAVAEAARSLQKSGIDHVCVSLGPDGAILVDNDNSYHCNAPRVHKQSTVGCGDALVAGLVTAARRGEAPPLMLRFAVACGSATASHPGTELFTRADLGDTELPDMEVTTLDI